MQECLFYHLLLCVFFWNLDQLVLYQEWLHHVHDEVVLHSACHIVYEETPATLWLVFLAAVCTRYSSYHLAWIQDTLVKNFIQNFPIIIKDVIILFEPIHIPSTSENFKVNLNWPFQVLAVKIMCRISMIPHMTPVLVGSRKRTQEWFKSVVRTSFTIMLK